MEVCHSAVRGEHFTQAIILDGTGTIAGQSFAYFLYVDRVFDPLLTRTTAVGGGLVITNAATREVTVTLDSDTTKSSTLPAGDYKWEIFRTDGGFEDRLATGWLSLVDSGFAQVDGPPLPTPPDAPLSVALGGTGRSTLTAGTILGGNGTAAVSLITVGSGLDLTAGVLTVAGPLLTGLNASELASGTVPDARLAAVVARTDAAKTWTAIQTFAASTIAIGPFIVQQSGGTAGTDQIELSHDGSVAIMRNRDTGGFAWQGSAGTDLITFTSDGQVVRPSSFRVGQFGGLPGIWFGGAADTPSFSNYAFLSTGGDTLINDAASVIFRIANATQISIGSGTVGFYGQAAVARGTLAANAADLATAITLVNDIKTKLIALGLCQ